MCLVTPLTLILQVGVYGFRRLIRCNFDRTGMSHSRTRGVLKYIVNMSPPIPSIVQLDLKGSSDVCCTTVPA